MTNLEKLINYNTVLKEINKVTIGLTATLLFSCGSSLTSDWSKETHSNDVEPNFDVVFAPTVMRIDITLSEADWGIMWDDLDANMGRGGQMGGPGGRGGEGGEMGGPGGRGGEGGEMGGPGGRGGEMMGGRGGEGGEMGGRGGEMMGGRGGEGGGAGGRGGAPGSTNNFTPVWVPCTVTCDGIDWHKVGVRFKGNSSLMRAYSSNDCKLSLKLDFDKFEKEYPELKNQRFYGFQQLNLNNNLDDYSFMREKVVSDLFREFGLAAAHTRFCEVYIKYDDGEPKLAGLYTLVEEVDDTVIETQFEDGSGNVYKPDSPAGTFALGTFEEEGLYLKTNKKTADYSDVRALYDVLHREYRTTDVDKWKSELEQVFNVDIFLKWLAASNAIQNWDAYGSMAHNYYLYNNPSDGRLTWIPWDHNESLQQGKGRTTGDLYSISRTSDYWPLISYLLAVDEYKTKFDNYLREFADEVFQPSQMNEIFDRHYTTIKEYAEKDLADRSPNATLESSVTRLKTHVQSRHKVIEEYLK